MKKKYNRWAKAIDRWVAMKRERIIEKIVFSFLSESRRQNRSTHAGMISVMNMFLRIAAQHSNWSLFKINRFLSVLGFAAAVSKLPNQITNFFLSSTFSLASSTHEHARRLEMLNERKKCRGIGNSTENSINKLNLPFN